MSSGTRISTACLRVDAGRDGVDVDAGSDGGVVRSCLSDDGEIAWLRSLVSCSGSVGVAPAVAPVVAEMLPFGAEGGARGAPSEGSRRHSNRRSAATCVCMYPCMYVCVNEYYLIVLWV